MTSRYRPNEPTSPVPLDVLSLLMRSEEARVAEIVRQLSGGQRAALAVYCFARAHMRSLGLQIARHCEGRTLVAVGGPMGQTMADQVESGEAFDVGPYQHGKRKVTLARFAA
ncbi:hypothetical protein [Aureimonas leprariae]|uniref:Uncharacterized protein n=1 Tax=Plantimonas leprariae TaxID=2615207 RepID=A0A7V7TVM7_9HYPH|nr:hypothetical protein [Aureimonas leprariae]KAB0678101.1 hypothetical protein F6X38_16895 [Aureimonas leprariae]